MKSTVTLQIRFSDSMVLKMSIQFLYNFSVLSLLKAVNVEEMKVFSKTLKL